MTSVLSGTLCTFLGVAIWLYSNTFPVLEEGHPGPSLFPRMIGLGLAVTGVILFVRGLRERTNGFRIPERARLLRFGAGVAVAAIYPALQMIAGTIPALILSCLAVALVLGLTLRTAVFTAIGSGLLIYAVFNGLLRVPL